MKTTLRRARLHGGVSRGVYKRGGGAEQAQGGFRAEPSCPGAPDLPCVAEAPRLLGLDQQSRVRTGRAPLFPNELFAEITRQQISGYRADGSWVKSKSLQDEPRHVTPPALGTGPSFP